MTTPFVPTRSGLAVDRANVSPTSAGARHPVLDGQALEYGEVGDVGGDYRDSVRRGNRGDLSVDDRRLSSGFFKPHAFRGEPFCRLLGVRQDPLPRRREPGLTARRDLGTFVGWAEKRR